MPPYSPGICQRAVTKSQEFVHSNRGLRAANNRAVVADRPDVGRAAAPDAAKLGAAAAWGRYWQLLATQVWGAVQEPQLSAVAQRSEMNPQFFT